MDREMCDTCPFNPESRTFYIKDGWIEQVQKKIGNKPWGCHRLTDLPATGDDDVCVGFKDYLQHGIKED